MFQCLHKRTISLLFLFFLGVTIFAQTLTPQTDVFFTQAENCYKLEIFNTEPKDIQIELPELPRNAKFVSSQKEGFRSEDGAKGTRIYLWFTFSESGKTTFPPLFTKINGNPYYFEFEQTEIYENPALVSPILEAKILSQKTVKSEKTGIKTLTAKKNEKIVFLVNVKYASEISDFAFTLPKDSIFTESERSEFAKGRQKTTGFTNKPITLARFEWRILKEGTYSLPDISALATAFNGQKNKVTLLKDTHIVVTNADSQNKELKRTDANPLFANAFETTAQETAAERQLSNEELKKLAQSESRTIFQRVFNKKYALFAGGEISSVPEKNGRVQTVSGGQKVKIAEKAGEWSFIECEEFSGWTQNKNLIEIK